MKPPHPTIDALLHEVDALLRWWLLGPTWHTLVAMLALLFVIVLMAKALASTDRATVERITRERK